MFIFFYFNLIYLDMGVVFFRVECVACDCPPTPTGKLLLPKYKRVIVDMKRDIELTFLAIHSSCLIDFGPILKWSTDAISIFHLVVFLIHSATNANRLNLPDRRFLREVLLICK